MKISDALATWSEHASEQQRAAIVAAVSTVMLKLGERRLEISVDDIRHAVGTQKIDTNFNVDTQTWTFRIAPKAEGTLQPGVDSNVQRPVVSRLSRL